MDSTILDGDRSYTEEYFKQLFVLMTSFLLISAIFLATNCHKNGQFRFKFSGNQTPGMLKENIFMERVFNITIFAGFYFDDVMRKLKNAVVRKNYKFAPYL